MPSISLRKVSWFNVWLPFSYMRVWASLAAFWFGLFATAWVSALSYIWCPFYAKSVLCLMNVRPLIFYRSCLNILLLQIFWWVLVFRFITSAYHFIISTYAMHAQFSSLSCLLLPDRFAARWMLSSWRLLHYIGTAADDASPLWSYSLFLCFSALSMPSPINLKCSLSFESVQSGLFFLPPSILMPLLLIYIMFYIAMGMLHLFEFDSSWAFKELSLFSI